MEFWIIVQIKVASKAYLDKNQIKSIQTWTDGKAISFYFILFTVCYKLYRWQINSHKIPTTKTNGKQHILKVIVVNVSSNVWFGIFFPQT